MGVVCGVGVVYVLGPLEVSYHLLPQDLQWLGVVYAAVVCASAVVCAWAVVCGVVCGAHQVRK